MTYRSAVFAATVTLVALLGVSTASASVTPKVPAGPTIGAFGTVTSIDGSSTPGACGTSGDTTTSFTVTTWRGTTAFTVNLTVTTTFVEPGIATPSFADVCVGEMGGAVGAVSDTTVTATTVYVAPTRAHPASHGATAFGTVMSVGGSSTPGSCGTAGDTTTPFALVTWRGTGIAYTVTLSSTSSFIERGVASPTYAAVCVGDVVAAAGTVSGSSVTNATTVYLNPVLPPQPQGVFGTVVSIGGSNSSGICGTAGDVATAFVVLPWKGTSTYTVTPTATTTFVEPGISAPTYANVCVGEMAGTVGAVSTGNNTVAAATVFVTPFKKFRPRGRLATVTSVEGSSVPGTCGTPGDTITPYSAVTWRGTATTYTVDVSASTTFAETGLTAPTYGDVCVGDVVGTTGAASGATISAGAVFVMPLTTTSSSSGGGSGGTPPSLPPPLPAPTSIVAVCGNAALLTGPSSAPPGSVTVPAGNDSSLLANGTLPADTEYWLAPGTHTIGSGEFDQIDPGNGDTFIGGPSAVLNGENANDYAFSGSGTGVTIEYLTVEGFTAPLNAAAVNAESGANWTIQNDTITENPDGAGAIIATNGVLTDSCLTENGQYGFQTYSGSDSLPVSNLTITDNEISDNDTKNYDTDGTGDCGCTGGAKFWNDLGATVTGNWVHDNESVGLWMDTNNTGFDISDNYFSNNWDVAIQYEISYNVSITNNTFIDNGWIAGPNNPGTGAIEINNSGSDSRVPGTYGTQSVVSGNVLTNNWGGVVIYEDSNRFCSSKSDNTSQPYCTLVDPSTYTIDSCTTNDVAGATPAANPDYYDNCRWKSENLLVTDNTFNFTPSAIGSDCTAAAGCGVIGLYSEWGTYAPYDGYAVPVALMNNQGNSFSDNTYNGPWTFDSEYQGDTVTWAQWSGGYLDPNSGQSIDPQDAGSTLNGSPAP